MKASFDSSDDWEEVAPQMERSKGFSAEIDGQ
jgi:hypothetical protein